MKDPSWHAVGGVGADDLAGCRLDLGEGVFHGYTVVGSLQHGDIVAVVTKDHDAVGAHLAGKVTDGTRLAGACSENLQIALALVKDVMVEHHRAGGDRLQVGCQRLEHGILVHREDEQGLIGIVAIVLVVKEEPLQGKPIRPQAEELKEN